MDIKRKNGKVILDDGKLVLTKSRPESLAQRLSIRISTFLGTWYLDEQMGIDYFEQVFEKGIPKKEIDRIFQIEIYKDELVQDIVQFKSIIKDNVYHLDFKVTTRSGAVSDNVYAHVTPTSFSVEI